MQKKVIVLEVSSFFLSLFIQDRVLTLGMVDCSRNRPSWEQTVLQRQESTYYLSRKPEHLRSSL